MPNNYSALEEEARQLARQLFGNNARRCASFTARVLDICTRTQGKDFLLIHNPGGLGNKPLEQCLQWERSIVDGISDTLQSLGYTRLVIQHFRAGKSLLERMRYMKELSRISTLKAKILATELEFIIRHVNNLKVILIGASQGAAFGNVVMQQSGELGQVYSIELGMIFTHRPRRVVTERTLVIDSNGVVPDIMMERDIPAIVKAHLIAIFRWTKYRLSGKRVRFFDCVNAPGHEYSWEYPEVQQQIVDFLAANFGNKRNSGGRVS